jgi:hypothetical protein
LTMVFASTSSNSWELTEGLRCSREIPLNNFHFPLTYSLYPGREKY